MPRCGILANCLGAALFRPRIQFALFFVSSFTAKLLHLGSHASSLPILLYLLYFPTFLLPDVLLLVGSKLLLYRQNGGVFRRVTGAFLALFTAACSAAQISFSLETGGEIQWMAANRVLAGGGGLGLLLSGLPAVLGTFAVLYLLTWVIANKFYDAVEHVLDTIAGAFTHISGLALGKEKSQLPEAEPFLITLAEQEKPPTSQDTGSSTSRAIAVLSTTLTFCIVTLILVLVRPRRSPFAHMSGSLPVTLIEAALFQPINSEFCLARPVEEVLFPWDQFAKYYEQPQSADWMASSKNCSSRRSPWHHPHPPGHHGPPPPPGHHGPPPPPGHRGPAHDEHPPPPPPHMATQDGFRSDGHPSHHRHRPGPGYEPQCDPLKLSNLGADVQNVLAAGSKARKPRIKNVLLLTLESTRKDMFPLKKDSHAYKTILSSYSSPNASEELDAKLRRLTPIATFLSGESNGFDVEDDVSTNSWRHAFKDGMGGINVQGAVTQAAFTLKSLLSSHCGVEPLPVDFTEETKLQIYQSCLPQVFDGLGSQATQENHADDDHRTWPWKSAMVQSVTDKFDSQDILHEHMGFSVVISEQFLSNPESKHYPPKQPRVNYFGYPETETLPYLRDLFTDASSQKERLFVSHLTSSPHHPYKTPKDWEGREEYLSKRHWRPEDPLEGYLNSIKFQDDWIDSIFQMLHELGVLNETLIIMAGDHGLAFDALDNSKSTVDNGHISNFAIPLLFVHPDLPRLNLNASTTPVSILPTVLDLLLETGSLVEEAAETAKMLVPKYQGTSLIREQNYTTNPGSTAAFWEPWHFSAINPGGSLLAISDASSSYRLIFPLCSSIPLRLTDLESDPLEASPTNAWTPEELAESVEARYGVKAKEWAELAQNLGRWWFWEQHKNWGYRGIARATGRSGSEVAGAGRVKGKKWWET